MLAALQARRPVEEPVALVVAHPDDETLAAGGSLHLFRRLLLVHVTDGAPRRLGDAAREGFAGPADYAAGRAAELDAALALSGATIERVSLGIADQEAADKVELITARLRGIATVLTHPYEGGHPDHDAVALAASRSGATIYEFAGYHADAGGSLVSTGFLEPSPAGGRGQGEGGAIRRRSGTTDHPHPGPLPPAGEGESEITLSHTELARKRAMLACFHTQRDILSRFDPAIERFRPAPAYDFTRPPAAKLLYEEWGWLTFAQWQQRCGV